MGRKMTAKKGKSKNKRVTLTQAQAQAQAEATYWKILRMFLAAAMDVYGWQEQEVPESTGISTRRTRSTPSPRTSWTSFWRRTWESS